LLANSISSYFQEDKMLHFRELPSKIVTEKSFDFLSRFDNYTLSEIEIILFWNVVVATKKLPNMLNCSLFYLLAIICLIF